MSGRIGAGLRGRSGASSRRVALALAVVTLVCFVWWQPWRDRGGATPAPTATITRPVAVATATAASVPDRNSVPPTAPPATVAPMPALANTPRPGATPTSRVAGSLIYLGQIGGVPGIVAVEADGGARRLLAPGTYTALAWSPDGARFAALGGPGYEQIALFAADGRPLARYALVPGSDCDLRWSPDARFVTCVPSYPFRGRERTTVLIVDDAGLREALVPPVVRTAFLGWPEPGLLGVVGLPEEWPYAAAEVWLIALASGEVRRSAQGEFSPLGWSADGRTLLALGGRQPRGGLLQPGEPVFTELIALDTASGERRTLSSAGQLARIAAGAAPAARYWFSFGLLSPTGRQLALWIARDPPSGTPPLIGGTTEPILAILALGGAGELATIAAVLPNAAVGTNPSWSPDGQTLARDLFSPVNRRLFLALVAPIVAPTPVWLDSRGEATVTWSPDSRWLAYLAAPGLVIASVDGLNLTVLDPEGRAPAWRPAGR